MSHNAGNDNWHVAEPREIHVLDRIGGGTDLSEVFCMEFSRAGNLRNG